MKLKSIVKRDLKNQFCEVEYKCEYFELISACDVFSVVSFFNKFVDYLLEN